MQYRHIQEIYPEMCDELISPPKGFKLPWMPKMTEALNGLRVGEITLLCAPTGVGKTELLASIAAQLLLDGIPVFAAPIETGDRDFAKRVFSVICRQSLNHGLAVPVDQMQQLHERYGQRFSTLPLYIARYDNRVEVKELLDVMNFAHLTHGCQVALLDNLNFFLHVVSSDKEKMEMDRAIHEFVLFGKKIQMHTILIVHPRKTDHGRVESEFDIKGSSTAVQECANVALFNRPSIKHREELGIPAHWRELVFRKIRKKGSAINQSIWLNYEQGHYSEVKNYAQPPQRYPGRNF